MFSAQDSAFVREETLQLYLLTDSPDDCYGSSITNSDVQCGHITIC